MKYNYDQLELIAIMFKLQLGDKTASEVFPAVSFTSTNKIGDLIIVRGECIYENDVDFLSSEDSLILSFRFETQYVSFFEAEELYKVPISEVVNMLDFKDKV